LKSLKRKKQRKKRKAIFVFFELFFENFFYFEKTCFLLKTKNGFFISNERQKKIEIHKHTKTQKHKNTKLPFKILKFRSTKLSKKMVQP
jgi:hypothetical protein